MVRKLADFIEEHEGREHTIYIDTVGKWTGGVGRNISDRAFSDSEIDLMLDNDIIVVQTELAMSHLPMSNLEGYRCWVIYDMAFNLGVPTLKKFEKMWAAIEVKDWQEASIQMLESRWARQVGNRAVRLSRMMEGGCFVDKWW